MPCRRQTTIGVEQIWQSAIQQRSDSKYQWLIRSARQRGQLSSATERLALARRCQQLVGVGEDDIHRADDFEPAVEQQIAEAVFTHAFVNAMRPTMVLPIVIVLAAAVSCLAVRNRGGLASHAQHALAGTLFKGCGGILSFELADGVDCFDFLNRLEIVVSSSNLGDNRTLAIPVAHTIFWEMGPERRKEMGIAESLIRVSIGIEDEADLIRDFTQALG